MDIYIYEEIFENKGYITLITFRFDAYLQI